MPPDTDLPWGRVIVSGGGTTSDLGSSEEESGILDGDILHG